MAKMGWAGGGLGKDGEGRLEPVPARVYPEVINCFKVLNSSFLKLQLGEKYKDVQAFNLEGRGEI